jgi:DNA-binding LacI/PurR family transcriptional regulator
MKATIREHVAGNRLRDAVPPAYRDQLVRDINPQGAYTLILCAHSERDVIHSAPLVQAFRRLKSQPADGIIVVGTVFTAEAQAIAAEHGARIVALRKGRWTDESARQRQL